MTKPDAIFLHAPVKLAAAKGDELPTEFSGVAYSGGYVEDYNLVIDLDSAEVVEIHPLLFDHTSITLGVVNNVVKSHALEVSGRLFSDIEPEAERLAKKAQAGLPLQMSIGAFNSSYEDVPAGTTVTVNGQEFAGPITVLRNSKIRETSIVPLGADHKTHVELLSHFSKRSEANPMSDKKTDDDALKQRVAELEAKLGELKSERDELAGQLDAMRKEARLSAIKQLFDSAGMEFSDDAAKPWLSMSDEHFELAAKALPKKQSATESLNPDLFRSTANDGGAAGGQEKPTINMSAIYAARKPTRAA